MLAKPTNFLRGGENDEGGGDRWITDPEQRTSAWRLQNHRIAASPHIGEPRQHNYVGIAKLWRLRPVIGPLRFNDDQVLIVRRMPEAVLQQAALRQSSDQQVDFLVDRVAVGRKGGKWQTCG